MWYCEGVPEHARGDCVARSITVLYTYMSIDLCVYVCVCVCICVCVNGALASLSSVT